MQKRVETIVMNVGAKATKWCEESGFGAFWKHVSSRGGEFKYTRGNYADMRDGTVPLVTLSFDNVNSHLYRTDDKKTFSLRLNDKEVLLRNKVGAHDTSDPMETCVDYVPETLAW